MKTAEWLAQNLPLRRMMLSNRVIRAATFEGMAKPDGSPGPGFEPLYTALAQGGAAGIVSGFMAISEEGRAMHPGQCRMITQQHVNTWREVTDHVHEKVPSAQLIAQIAHAGRQTVSHITGHEVVGAGPRQCTYFRQSVRPLTAAEVSRRAGDFGVAAGRVRDAGFDAVQIHAAHGYLIHQFLSPWTNSRTDAYADRNRFLLEVLDAVHMACGPDFPVWLKLSFAEERRSGIRLQDTIDTVRQLDAAGVDAIVISTGTMEWPMNIFRGGCPTRVALRINPLLRQPSAVHRLAWYIFRGLPHLCRLRRFHENYTLGAACEIQKHTATPVIAVGGIRSGESLACCAEERGVAGIGLCRPLIREPAFAKRLLSSDDAVSDCSNCNLCAIMCDSKQTLRCYKGE